MTSTIYPNDQPTVTFGYNTDQFQDPVTGMTVHDDGSPTYTDSTGQVYTKQRFINGWCAFNVSNNIQLALSLYVTEDGSAGYVTEDSVSVFYGPES
jgi:hypothetical protein